MASHIGRRKFLATLGGAAAAWPLAARAQQAPIPVVGVLDSVADAFHFSAFRNGLSEAGYVIGRNVVLDVRSTNQYDQLPALAADLASSHPAVLVALGGPATPAVKAATTTIPIVFSIGGDPVELGFVANIGRPGGNITGTTFFTAQLLQKQVGVMRELFPKARAFGVLVNPRNPRAVTDLASVRAAAGMLGIEIYGANASAKSDFEGAFAAFQSKHVDALIILGDPLASREEKGLAEMTLRQAVPAMYFAREFPQAGGLISYGANSPDAYWQAGRYVGRILKGERPGDLPVLQPTRFELVINLKTAKALGLEIPPTLLAIADEVIE
jgi:putative tryptophan/tyrosine transport system substrate-binding protein